MKKVRNFIAIWIWAALTCLLMVSQGFPSSVDLTSERISPDIVIEISINDGRKSEIASVIIQQGKNNGFKPHQAKYDLTHFFDRDVFFVVLEHPIGSRVVFTDAHDDGFVQIGFYEFEALGDGKLMLNALVESILKTWPDEAYVIKNNWQLPL